MITTRTQLKEWFVPSFKLIADRIASVFDSFFHKEDDVKIYPLLAADQTGDYSITKQHDLDAESLLVQLQDADGKVQFGTEVQNIYVDGKCNQTKIQFSDPIVGTYQLTILKIK